MSINAAISTINIKLLIVIIGLLMILVGIGAKFAYDQHQITVLMQAEAAKKLAQEAASRARDEQIMQEQKQRSDRLPKKSEFYFKPKW